MRGKSKLAGLVIGTSEKQGSCLRFQGFKVSRFRKCPA
jgi:hypothetical protein